MRKTITTLVVIAVLAIIILALGPFYVINEGEQVVITRFGKIVTTETEAGLKLKWPVVDSVVRFSKKMLAWDGDPQRLPTAENQYIWVDTTARWRIVDLKKFYSNIKTLEKAYGRLDNVIESAIRTVVANNNLVEAVRNSNKILESSAEADVINSSVADSVMAEIRELTNVNEAQEAIEKGRRELSEEVNTMLRGTTIDWGIELVDVVIRQIRYSDDLTTSVYERMIKERNQIAEAYRSLGEGKKSEWLGKLDNEQRTVLSEAYATAEEIRGQADAEATRIYSEAYQDASDFYEFWRTIESYKKVLPNFKKTFSTDMEFFKYLYSSDGVTQ